MPVAQDTMRIGGGSQQRCRGVYLAAIRINTNRDLPVNISQVPKPLGSRRPTLPSLTATMYRALPERQGGLAASLLTSAVP